MNRKKAIILVAMVALLLTFAVSGTIAWLMDSTEKVENVFTPAKVETKIEETFDGTTKLSITVKNDDKAGSNISVFVRVSVSGYYVKDGNVVDTWDGDIDITSDWFKGSDGYYYYKTSVDPGSSTSNLLSSGITPDEREDGSYLVVNVLHQSIQAEPTSVVEKVWGVKVAENGIISE